MAIKCQHQQHDDPDNHTDAKKSLLEEEKPKESSIEADADNTNKKYELQHVKNDWFEKGKDLITLHVYIKELKKDHLDVGLCEDELNVQFATSDDKFLNMYQGTSEDTVFNWNVKLRGKIDVPSSSFKILKYMIEINLKKQTSERWGSLQKPNLPGLNSTRCKDTKEFTTIDPDAPTKDPTIRLNGEMKHSPINNNNSSRTDTHQQSVNGDVDPKEENEIGEATNCSIQNDVEADAPNINLTSKCPPSAPAPPAPPPLPQTPTTNRRPAVVGGSKGISLSDAIKNATSAARTDDMYDNDVDMNRQTEVCMVNKGFTGLENLGNTCYLNSIIQCLSNTRLLRDFFISGEYKEDLNTDNPLSFGGKLAVVFANLMKHMWSGRARHVAPHQLKTLVGEKVCQFRGFMQQDAQEFMAFLLDGLHEDLNRIINKPYTEEVEGAGRPDHVVAQEAWSRYKSRNDSAVVDMFQGQLKSKLTCPVCKKISIKFDPFMNLSVPLPKEQKLLNVVVFFKDPSRTPLKVSIKVCQDANLEQLTAAIERKTGVREENMRVIEEFQGKFHKFFEKGSSLTNVVSTDNIFVFEVLSLEEAGEEVYEVPIMQRLLYPHNIPLHCADCYKNQDPADPLKRCIGCFSIGYCNRKCQERHWPMHKKHCKKSGKHAIGKPFIVSMPASQATYTRLKDLAEEYAKLSVEVRDGEPMKDSPAVNGDKDELQTASDESFHDSMPRFFFKPVNVHGEPVMGPEGARMSDQGDQALDLNNKVFGLDWRNNPKTNDWVIVKKKTLEVEEHPSYEHEELSTSFSCSLRECLELYTEPETLGKDDAWYCPKCKVHREATKQLSVWRLPEILIIHLKRFSFRNILYRDKITKLVDFPLRGLDMSDFTVSKNRSSDNIYDLFAVSNHMGTVNFGHYTAYGRIPETRDTMADDIGWRYFDDRSVSASSEDRVVSKCAYVLFYQRRRSSKPRNGKPVIPVQESTSTSSKTSPDHVSFVNHTSLRKDQKDDVHDNLRTCEEAEEAVSKDLHDRVLNGDQTMQAEEKHVNPNSCTKSENDAVDKLVNGNAGCYEEEEPHPYNRTNGGDYTTVDQSEVDECELD